MSSFYVRGEKREEEEEPGLRVFQGILKKEVKESQVQ